MREPEKGTQDVSSFAERLRRASWSWGSGAQGAEKQSGWVNPMCCLAAPMGLWCLDFAFQELCTLTRTRPPLS